MSRVLARFRGVQFDASLGTAADKLQHRQLDLASMSDMVHKARKTQVWHPYTSKDH